MNIEYVFFIFIVVISIVSCYNKSLFFGINHGYDLSKYSKITSKLMMTKKDNKDSKNSDLILRQNLLLGFISALCLKLNFTPSNLRNTYICPYGAGAEHEQKELQNSLPDYHCLTTKEYASKLLSAPLVIPGDERYDSEFFKTKMITITKYGTKKD